MEGACVRGRFFFEFPSNPFISTEARLLGRSRALASPLHGAILGFGHIDSPQEVIEGFYDFWYNFDSWRVSSGWLSQ